MNRILALSSTAALALTLGGLTAGCETAELDAAAPTVRTGEPEDRGPADDQRAIDPDADEPAMVTRAVARVTPTKGNTATGEVRFTQTDDGLLVSATMAGLAPGVHGFHVHLLGDCTAPDATSAGTHFNFKGPSKEPPADIDRITGNLGELRAGDDGMASLQTTVGDAAITGPHSILGRAVIVHAKGNDPTAPPIGAAGARLACGVIGIDGAS